MPVYSNVGQDTGAVAGGEIFRFPAAISSDRLHDRRALLADLDHLRSGLDLGGSMDALNHFQRQAVEMLVGRRAQDADR